MPEKSEKVEKGLEKRPLAGQKTSPNKMANRQDMYVQLNNGNKLSILYETGRNQKRTT
jgi:hypothetical protein